MIAWRAMQGRQSWTSAISQTSRFTTTRIAGDSSTVSAANATDNDPSYSWGTRARLTSDATRAARTSRSMQTASTVMYPAKVKPPAWSTAAGGTYEVQRDLRK